MDDRSVWCLAARPLLRRRLFRPPAATTSAACIPKFSRRRLRTSAGQRRSQSLMQASNARLRRCGRPVGPDVEYDFQTGLFAGKVLLQVFAPIMRALSGWEIGPYRSALSKDRGPRGSTTWQGASRSLLLSSRLPRPALPPICMYLHSSGIKGLRVWTGDVQPARRLRRLLRRNGGRSAVPPAI